VKLIRDPVHGYVEINDRALGVISNPYFQRLRHITQTGLAYLVYPGMTHSRFEHSVGSMYLASEFLRYIARNSRLDFVTDDYVSLVSVIALLHDVGHLPFSHTWENGLEAYKTIYGEISGYRGRKTHVDLGIRLIEEVFSDALERAYGGFVSDPVGFAKRVLMESPRNDEERLATLVISNFIDADRGDYLLRDSYHAGVEYGIYDIERLKRFLTYVDGRLAVMRKAVPIVEHFLLARMYMYQNVYFHDVVGMYNAVLAFGLAKLFREGRLDPIPEARNYLDYVDFQVLSLIRGLEKFRDGVIYRRGWKRLKTDLDEGCVDILRKEVNQLTASTEGLVILHEFRDAPYKETKTEAVYIYDGEVYELSRVSAIARAIAELKKGIIVYHVSQEKEVQPILKEAQDCMKSKQEGKRG
jgi:HD superfamily phosphohydrolase